MPAPRHRAKAAPRFDGLEPRTLLNGQVTTPAAITVNPEIYDPTRILVRYRDQAEMAAGPVNLQVTDWGAPLASGQPDLRVVSVPGGRSVGSVLSAYRADPRVAYAEPDYEVRLELTPNDARYPQQWDMNNARTPAADIDAPGAWDIITGSSSTIVAVIDTGIDYNHPDLADNIWTNTGEIPGDGVDNDNDGYIDDVHGYDFYNNDGDPMDDHGHGTHVAGTIGARGNNGIGVAGINWNVQLMPLKFLNSAGSGSISAAAAALYYAVEHGATISNSSWGGTGFSQAMFDAINYAGGRGHLFVAAAGNYSRNNDATPFYPASYDAPNVVSVAATGSVDELASYSNYGLASVDLGAPGSGIVSTLRGGGYGSMSGTSMASPHVAGVAALIKSQNPSWTPSQVKDRLLTSVDVVPSLVGKTVTGGRLNAARAVGLPAATSYTLAAPSPAWAPVGTASGPFTVALPAGHTVYGPVTVTPSDGGQGGVFNPTQVVLTSAVTSAQFTYTGTSAGVRAIRTTNNGGLADPTAVSFEVTAPPVTIYQLSGPSVAVAGRATTPYTVDLTGIDLGELPIRITPSDGGAGGTFSPAFLDLTNDTRTASFTYTPASAGALTISVANARGLTNPSPLPLAVRAPGAVSTTQSGLWSDPSTWGGQAPPGDGDTATVNHAVTLDGVVTLGTSVTGNVALTIRADLTIADGAMLVLHGSVLQGLGTTTTGLGAGWIRFDATTAAGSSRYIWTIGDGNADVSMSNAARFVIRGTSERRFRIESALGGMPGYFTHGGYLGGGCFDAAYADLVRLGDATTMAISTAGLYRAVIFRLDHVVLSDSGSVGPSALAARTPGAPYGAATVQVTNTVIMNSAASYSLTLMGTRTTGVWEVRDSDIGTYMTVSLSYDLSGNVNRQVWYRGGVRQGASPGPYAATSYSVMGPSAGVSGAASEPFTVTLANGTVASSPVTVVFSDGGAGGTFSPASVVLTTASPSATFTYTPAGAGTVVLSFSDNGTMPRGNGTLRDPEPLSFLIAASASMATQSGASTFTPPDLGRKLLAMWPPDLLAAGQITPRPPSFRLKRTVQD